VEWFGEDACFQGAEQCPLFQHEAGKIANGQWPPRRSSNKRGYEGSSLNDLMEATGLKKGGIYRHFSSKEELAAEAFDYTWDVTWNARLLHVDEKTNGIKKLKRLITNFIDHRSRIAGGCPI
jgi:AcrR family transcriptional regulator